MKYKFEYDTEKFNLLATVLVKLDKDLEQAYENLVPIQISDEEFWTNYFYQVELIKHEHGLPCLLGQELSIAERSANIDAQQNLLQQMGILEEDLEVTQEKKPDDTQTNSSLDQSKVGDDALDKTDEIEL